MKKFFAILALTAASAHAHPGHPGHEFGDVSWGSHPLLGTAFVVLLTVALFISRRTPRLLVGLCAAIAGATIFLMR